MRSDTYDLPTSPPNPGKTLFLLGQAKDGPINTPIPIRSLTEAKKVFGPEEEGDLVRAYNHASRVAGITTYMMRISGEYAKGILLGSIEEQVLPVVKLRSIHGGENYNSIKMYIQPVPHNGATTSALIIESPADKQKPHLAYLLHEYTTIQELVLTINADARNNDGFVYATSEYSYADISCLDGHNTIPTYLTEGLDGINLSKDDLYLALDASYSILEGREVDIIHPVSACFDDTHPVSFYGSGVYGSAVYATDKYLTLVDTERGNRIVTFHEQLIEFCRSQERFGIMTHGVLAMNERTLSQMNPFHISRIIRATGLEGRYGLIDYSQGNWYDKGYFISIFSHDFVYDKDTASEHYHNGAATYASMVASLSLTETTTNRPLPEGVTLRYELSNEEIKDLAALGIVTARESISKGPVIANGVTAGLAALPMHLITNVKIVQHAIYLANYAVSELIGETSIPVITDKEIERRIDTALSTLVSDNRALKEYSIQVSLGNRTSEGTVKLNLVPRYSVESVSTVSYIRQRLGG